MRGKVNDAEEIDEEIEGIQAVIEITEEVTEEQNADSYKNQNNEMDKRNVRSANKLQGRISK